MHKNPTTTGHGKRQSLVTHSGAVLERSYVFLPAASWAALQTLCAASHSSNSQVIERLINEAISGEPTKDKDERTSTSSN